MLFSEEEVIEGCKNKEMGARAELYRRFLPKMFGVCNRLVADRIVAEDLVHDGFMVVFIKINDYKGTGSFEGWLRHVFINISLDYLKKRKTVSIPEQDGLPVYDIITEPEDIDNLDYTELMEIIERLPDDLRVIVSLFCVEGFTHKEISKMLGIGIRTSKKRLNIARFILIKNMEGYINPMDCQEFKMNNKYDAAKDR